MYKKEVWKSVTIFLRRPPKCHCEFAVLGFVHMSVNLQNKKNLKQVTTTYKKKSLEIMYIIFEKTP